MTTRNNEPLVSVVIPMYNERKHIKATLESLVAQEYNSIELVIVDDGSDDDSSEVVNNYLRSAEYNFSIIENPTNIGQSFARNRGAIDSDGKYIVFHDADDVSTPDRFRKQIRYLETHPEVGVLGGGFFYVNPNRNQHGIRLRPTDDETIRQGMARESMINLGTAMFRREALFETRLFSSANVEGYELIVNIGCNWELANLAEPIYLYRINEGSRSQRNQLLKKLTLAYRSYQAINKFNLARWYIPLQLGWFIYMNAPNEIQSLIRGLFSPTEERELTAKEKRMLNHLQKYG